MEAKHFDDNLLADIGEHLDLSTLWHFKHALGRKRAEAVGLTDVLELNAARLPKFVKRRTGKPDLELLRNDIKAAAQPAVIRHLTAVHLCFGPLQLQLLQAIGETLLKTAEVAEKKLIRLWRTGQHVKIVEIGHIQIDLLQTSSDRNLTGISGDDEWWKLRREATELLIKALRRLRHDRGPSCVININLHSNEDNDLIKLFTESRIARPGDTLVIRNLALTGHPSFFNVYWNRVLASQIVLSGFKLDRTKAAARSDERNISDPAELAGIDAAMFFVELLQATETRFNRDPCNRVIRLENVQLWPDECQNSEREAALWSKGFLARFGHWAYWRGQPDDHLTTRIIYANAHRPWPASMANTVDDKIKAHFDRTETSSQKRKILAHERIVIVGYDHGKPVYRWFEVLGLPRMTQNEVNYTHHLPVDHHDDHASLIEKHTQGLNPRRVYCHAPLY